jgi:hypothetical protein
MSAWPFSRRMVGCLLSVCLSVCFVFPYLSASPSVRGVSARQRGPREDVHVYLGNWGSKGWQASMGQKRVTIDVFVMALPQLPCVHCQPLQVLSSPLALCSVRSTRSRLHSFSSLAVPAPSASRRCVTWRGLSPPQAAADGELCSRRFAA